MYDLLLRNAHVVDPLNHVNGIADVAVTDGKIAAVGRELTGEAKETVDLTGLVLQPGIIDSHVHLGSMWGSPYGPRMLAMKGVTTSPGRHPQQRSRVRRRDQHGDSAVCVSALYF